MTHGAELRHEEVVAPMIRRRVLLNIGKLHKLEIQKNKDLHISSPLAHSNSFPLHILPGAKTIRKSRARIGAQLTI